MLDSIQLLLAFGNDGTNVTNIQGRELVTVVVGKIGLGEQSFKVWSLVIINEQHSQISSRIDNIRSLANGR